MGTGAFAGASMAKGSLLGFLAWALPVQLAGTCLHCWPDAALYFGYDAYLLLGRDSEATDTLGKLFLGKAGDPASYGRGFLEREHMEREAGTLLLHLDRIIKKNSNDRELLMREAESEKKNFIKRLEEASNAFLKELCSLSCGQFRYKPYEVAQCANCRLLKVSCYDPMICAGRSVVVGVLVTLVILLGIGALVWYYHRKKKAGEKGTSQDDEESSESSQSSEASEESVSDSSPVNVPKLPEANFPSPPPFDIPSPPPFDIPSPPPFDIPSPPSGQ